MVAVGNKREPVATSNGDGQESMNASSDSSNNTTWATTNTDDPNHATDNNSVRHISHLRHRGAEGQYIRPQPDKTKHDIMKHTLTKVTKPHPGTVTCSGAHHTKEDVRSVGRFSNMNHSTIILNMCLPTRSSQRNAHVTREELLTSVTRVHAGELAPIHCWFLLDASIGNRKSSATRSECWLRTCRNMVPYTPLQTYWMKQTLANARPNYIL